MKQIVEVPVLQVATGNGGSEDDLSSRAHAEVYHRPNRRCTSRMAKIVDVPMTKNAKTVVGT